MLVFVMTATELVGLPVITSWLSGVASYLPRLFAALVVFAVGVGAGRLIRRAVARAASSAGVVYADRLGRFAQVSVVAVSVLVAVEQLGLELSFVTSAVMIVLGASLGAAALAFGLGSRAVVENILSGHYVRKLYDVGHVVRIDGIEGRILRMTATAVILQTRDGEVAVPTLEFTRVRSTLVARGG
jgi:small-conductance mechanosensitive channel